MPLRPGMRRPLWIRILRGTAIALVLAGASRAALAEGTPSATPSWRVQLRSTGYVFQSQRVDEPKLDRFGAYQDFDGSSWGLLGGKLSARISGRFADDLQLKERTTERSRLYNLNLTGRQGGVTARLGRQYLQEGSSALLLDGLWLQGRVLPCTELRFWGGGGAPATRAYKIGNLDKDPALGARAIVRPWRDLRVSASYAYRERGGVIAARPLGFEGAASLCYGLRASGRAVYDLEREGWDREELLAQWRPCPTMPSLTLQWLDRRPSIDAASWFSVFDEIERARVGRATLRYECAKGFGAEADYLGAFVDDRTSTRVGGAVVVPYGRVGYSARLGDAGEESQWFGEGRVRVFPWIRLDAGLSVLTYALLQDAPDDDQRDVTATFGARASRRGRRSA
ncbi:MAG: hypothetical protein U0527_00690 [Candidatus Eisenbacteria bacterium]